MCGIIAYVGPNPAFPIVIDGLKRLEYRGYDSAGIATIEPTGDLVVSKKKGKVADLESHTIYLSHNLVPSLYHLP